jgi:hypothetical protein
VRNRRYSTSFVLFDFGAAGALVGELTMSRNVFPNFLTMNLAGGAAKSKWRWL